MKTVRWRALGGLVSAFAIFASHSAQADDRAAHSIANKFAQDSAAPRSKPDSDSATLERKLQDEERFRADEKEMLDRAKIEAAERRAADAEAKRLAAEKDAEAKRVADEAEDKTARERAAREAALIKEEKAKRKAEDDARAKEAEIKAAEAKAAEAKAVAEAKAKADAEAKAVADAKAAEEKAKAEAAAKAVAEAKALAEAKAAEAKAKAEAAAKAEAEAKVLAEAKAKSEAEALKKAEAEKADAQRREIAAAKARIEEARQADEKRRKADEATAWERQVTAAREQRQAAEAAEKQRKMEAEREDEARRLSEKLARAREQREARGLDDQNFSALGGPKPNGREPEGADRSRRARADETRATILLVMEPGTRGIRRYEKTADPVVCVGTQCFVSKGLEDAATAMSRAQALGPGNTLGQRAGACRHALVCAFRDVEIGSGLVLVQPVDMRILRHDRRESQMLKIDQTCEVERGRLYCDHGANAGSYRVWIVPESVAREAGPGALEAALMANLPSGDSHAAADFDR